MSDIARLFQQQVPLDSKVKIFLTSGKEATGILDGISRIHVTLRNNGKSTTILLNMIGGWEVIEDVPDLLDEESTQNISAADNGLDIELSIIQQEANESSESTRTNIEVLPVPSQDEDSFVQETVIETLPVPSQDNISLSSDNNINLNVYTKVIEINAHFQAHLQTARIEIKPPDFILPTDELQFSVSQGDAKKLWDRFINRYKNAVKINELSVTHGRLPVIISDLEELSRFCPRSSVVYHHLAYFYYLAGQKQKSLESYKKVVANSKTEHDWHNLAAIAIECEQEELACYSLEQFFCQSAITESPNTWYLFIRLLLKFSNYIALKALSTSVFARNSEEELEILTRTVVFLLKDRDKEKIAQEIIQREIENQPYETLISIALEHLEKQPTDSYQKFLSEQDFISQEQVPTQPVERSQQQQGYVYTYKGKFGFLRDQSGQEYYFHSSAVIDPDLLPKLSDLSFRQEIPVIFQLAQGPKGDMIAVSVSAFRTVDEMFNLALKYANEGEYHKAISQIKKVLSSDPENQKAQMFYDKWREYARATGIPKGSNPYARAKQVQLIEKDLERAERLFRTAINQKDNWESAVKDLAQVLDRLGRTDEAIELLKRYRSTFSSKKSVDNLLVSLYRKAKYYDQEITLLNEQLQQAKKLANKIQLLWQIGNAYLRQERYTLAEQHFNQVLRLQKDNQFAARNLAICLFKQKRLDEAEQILNRILNTSPNTKVAELLDAIRQAKQTGSSGRLDEMIVELTLSELYLSGEVSHFTQFFLERCQFEGVRPEHVQTQEFVRSDIKRLEDLATKLGTSRPRERASYYLSAAKIVSILEDGVEANQFYKYLCRCFASMGDAAVIEGKHLDSARELYCEALAIYDGDRTQQKREQDAINALVRFLYSTLGQASIPIKPQIPTVDETLDVIFAQHPEKDIVFDAVAYLVSRSRYAANLILNRFYNKEYSLRAMALEYLKNQGIDTTKQINSVGSFVQLWNELRRKRFDELRSIPTEFHFIAGFEFTTASLEVRIQQIKKLGESLFVDLDHERLRRIQNILEIAFELCQQEKFSDQERLAEQIERNCQGMLDEIENTPTKISIEAMYPVIQIFQEKITSWKEELYKRSTPDVSMRCAIEVYIPERNQIEVQVAVENRVGCSPAESLELIVRPDETLFLVNRAEIRLYSSLEGGDREIIEISLRVTDQAIAAQAFSLPLYARYRTRSGEVVETQEYHFSIRLSSEESFEEISNPYAPYAESGIVEDACMFYGREELIQNIAQAIQNAKTKSVVIYGQKRAGKSSILYHLKKKLQTDTNLLILDWGNIGSIRNKDSQISLLYQILWGILEQLRFAIEDKVDEGFTLLELPLPTSSRDFFSHPEPLTHFNEIFERYKRKTAKITEWQDVRIVLLIDEFTYIFDWILKGEISDSFMQNWKALLQKNFFSAVLVGQDYMPKFKLRFPNEFGTTQDERVTYLRKEDAIRLIDEPIRIGGRQGESRYREQAIETIFALTAGSPFYIQIVCNRLVEYMNRKRAKYVTEADVKQVQDDLITGNNALDIGKFDNLINSGDTSADAISDTDALKILTTIAHNSRTGLCHRSNVVCKTITPIDQILGDLVHREVVEQRDQNYRIRVELFKEWLIAHPVR